MRSAGSVRIAARMIEGFAVECGESGLVSVANWRLGGSGAEWVSRLGSE